MSKYLEEKKNDLLTRADEILNKAKEETRELTDEEAQELTKLRDDVRRIKDTLNLDEEIRAMEMEKKVDAEPKEEKKVDEIKMRAIEGMDGLEVREDEYRAFDAFLRNKEMELRDGDVNMTKGDNGAIIPQTIVNWIIRKVYDICPILERSQKYNVKGTLQIPFYPADANNINVAYADEFVALTSSAGKMSSITLTGYLAGALTKVSRSLMNNAQIDVVGFVVDEMSYAIKRWIEHELLIGTPASGDDPAKVLGLSTLSNKVTAASESAITADEVIKLHDKIKDEFQGNAIWIMSPATRTALRLLKDEMGRYLLQDDISLPFGVSLLGKPIYVSDNMPEIGAGNTVIYYGDMHGLATKFNEEINIQVLREKYADEHAVGVIGWLEFDAKVSDEQQIAKLVMATASI